MNLALAPTSFPDPHAPLRMERAKIAAVRAANARRALSACRFCAHDCGVNRLAGERGLCGAGSDAHYFTAQLEVADELELIPTFAIALNGCDLRCNFCITGEMSWKARAGRELNPVALGEVAKEALNSGARTVMILGGEPTIYVPALLELAAALPDNAPLVLKTNGHCSGETRTWLEHIFDVWLVDYKFGNNLCAANLARIPNYLEVLHENLFWAATRSDLIIRHLLLPGHLECCWLPMARWIAEQLPGAKVSLRDGYWPAWHARRVPNMNRVVSRFESAKASQIATAFELNLIP